MMPSRFVIMMVSVDCWTAQESLRNESPAEFCFCRIVWRFSVHRMVRSSPAPLRSDFSARPRLPPE
jgi:hypothetical protein